MGGLGASATGGQQQQQSNQAQMQPSQAQMYQQMMAQMAAQGMMPGGNMNMGMVPGMMDPSMMGGYGQSAAAMGAYGQNAGANGGYAVPEQQYNKFYSSQAEGGAKVPHVFWKTRMCHKWEQGKCADSAVCKYAHGETELRVLDSDTVVRQVNIQAQRAANQAPQQMLLRQQQTMSGGEQPVMLVPRDQAEMRSVLHKTKLCGDFIRTGQCTYGDHCTFAHGAHELRAQPKFTTGKDAQFEPLQTGEAVKYCKNFLKDGNCKFGDRCKFYHGDPSTIGAMAESGLKRSMATEGMEANPSKRSNMSTGSIGMDGGAMTMSHEVHEAHPTVTYLECQTCHNLAVTDKDALLRAIKALENPKAQQVGVMIMSQARSLGNMWATVPPTSLRAWLARANLSVMERLDILRLLEFHSHDQSCDASGTLAYNSSRYMQAGLSKDVADFVMMCLDGTENRCTMEEYSRMLEVIRPYFGIDDESYFAFSTAIATFMMG
jgi:hypothetical protein